MDAVPGNHARNPPPGKACALWDSACRTH